MSMYNEITVKILKHILENPSIKAEEKRSLGKNYQTGRRNNLSLFV